MNKGQGLKQSSLKHKSTARNSNINTSTQHGMHAVGNQENTGYGTVA